MRLEGFSVLCHELNVDAAQESPDETSPSSKVNRILQTQPVRGRIADFGGEAAPMSPAELRDKQRVDCERFGTLIRELGIKAE